MSDLIEIDTDDIDIDDAPAYPLATMETETLTRCEAVIARGVQTFIEVGEALATIREQKLYRADFTTFEHYCRNKWGIGDSRARQLIGAASVAREIETVTNVTLSNEGQARAAAKVAPADRPEVLVRAVEIAGDQPLAARHITQAADEVTPPGWICESCGTRITDMRKPQTPICATCEIRRQAARSTAPDLPIEYAIIQRRYAALGQELTTHMQGQHRVYATKRPGMTGVAVFAWTDVLSKLERLEAAPSPDPSAPAFRMTCPTCGETLLNGVWGELSECGSCYHARQRTELSPPPELSAPVRLPAVPPRPKRPVSADASAVITYLKQLETYASALESVIQALQKQIPE